jgi:hypothetical protein
MRIIKTLLIGVLFVITAGLSGMLLIPGYIDHDTHTINFPVYRNVKTVTAIRDMITDLGWVHEAEEGDGKILIITAKDRNKTDVIFNYARNLARG